MSTPSTPSTPSKTALVTGAAGFIGSHLVRGLLGQGFAVRGLDDLSGSGSWSRLEGVDGPLTRITGSILDKETLRQAVDGVAVILHHAAMVSVPESVAKPEAYHAVDATGTLLLLEAARAAGVSKVVYAASSAAYGDAPEQPKFESHRAEPVSPYAVAKYAGELYLTSYAKLHGMNTISLRYFNVFGPGQNPKSQYGAAIPNIVSKMIRGERPTVYGDGQQTRDFCYIENIVAANMLAAKAPALHGEVVNIGCGRRVSVNDIVEQTNKVLGKAIKPNYEPARAGDVRDSLADISLAMKVLGYEPRVHFAEGLAQSISWYREHLG
jgi:nucleoside-diphosphate-sugar epimerase